MGQEALLKVKNIETLYGLIMAIRGVSLEIQEGQIAAILWANGAGKTTILKTIMGLLEDQPDKGTIEFLGKGLMGRTRRKSSTWESPMCRKEGKSSPS